MALFLRFDDAATQPDRRPIDPGRVLAGHPFETTWNHETWDGLHAGTWEGTPGRWRVAYAEWEYLRILAGHSILTAEDGSVQHLRAGDRVVIRPGFRGTWEVIETTRKDYVVHMCEGPGIAAGAG